MSSGHQTFDEVIDPEGLRPKVLGDDADSQSGFIARVRPFLPSHCLRWWHGKPNFVDLRGSAMRILLVSHGVSDQSQMGGPGRIAAAQANALTATGHEVSIITTNVTGKGTRTLRPTFRSLDHRVSVQWIPGWTWRYWPGTMGPVLHPRSKAVLADAIQRVDVVHCHDWPYHLVQEARRIARNHGTTCVIQPHGSIQPRSGAKRLVHAMFARHNSPLPGEVFLVGSAAEGAELKNALGPSISVHCVVNPVSIPAIDVTAQTGDVREAWGFPEGSMVLLYAHRIYPNKGLDLLIRALVSLPPSARLAVVGPIGHQAFATECERLTTQLGLSTRVRFFGPVPHDQMDAVLCAGDIFVLPARRDTFPIAVLEAMACGRPVVVTNTCQSVAVLRDAVAVAEPTPAGLAEQIKPLLDPGARASLGRRGLHLIEDEFAPSAVAERLEQIYRIEV